MKSATNKTIDDGATMMMELAAKLSKTIILDDGAEETNRKADLRILDVESFDDHVGRICKSLFHTLTSKQLEVTYQRCLAIDLQKAGVKVLAQEVAIQLQYKGENIATRRADIVLQTPSDKHWIVLELKAVASLTSDHMKQLQFYMHHFDIDTGYLINFPHDAGFPDLPSTAIYRQTILSGSMAMPSDRNNRAKNATEQVQIIKVERVVTADNDSSQSAQIAATPVLSSRIQTTTDVRSVAAAASATSTTFIVPIAKTTGEPCRICMRKQTYCRYHKP